MFVLRPNQAVIDQVKHLEDQQKDFDDLESPGAKQRDDLADGSGSGSTSNHDSNNGQDKQVEKDPSFTPQPFRREITFADEIRPERDDVFGDRLPSKLDTDHHIAFLENQRHPKDNSVLYIPGPRDFDRGDIPQQINEGEELEMLKFHKRTWSLDHNGEMSPTDNRLEKSTSPSQFSPGRLTVFSRFRPQSREATQEKAESTTGDISGLRRRRASFAQYMTFSDNGDDAMPPYLSWQPTIGRNSTFVDLSEEQREELGGIEYRALKTLAVVLCSEIINHTKSCKS